MNRRWSRVAMAVGLIGIIVLVAILSLVSTR